MDFNNKVYEFGNRIKSIKDSIATEEATKTSIILPFFALLGYDVFNPKEFVPEYVADVGIKKGEKVDYAIILDGLPEILIEAKSINKNLERHDSQLFRYFATTKSKFAILTNGIKYRVYTDLDELNKMDREPFYEFNLFNMTDEDIAELRNFSKESFDKEKLFENASVLKFNALFKETLAANVLNPSDDFVRLFLKDHYQGVKTQNVIDKFRPVLKKTFFDYIDETVKERLTSLVNDSGYSVVPEKKDFLAPSTVELTALEIIKTMLNDTVNMCDITYKQTESYFGILYKNNTRKWIARLIIKDVITLVIPDENKNELRFKLSDLDDLKNFKPHLTDILNRYIAKGDSENGSYVYTKWGKYKMPTTYKVLLPYGLPL